VLPHPGLGLAGRGGLGPAPGPWPGPWWSLAAAARRRLSPLLSRPPWPALAGHACLCRPPQAGPRLPGRGPGSPGPRPGVRGRAAAEPLRAVSQPFVHARRGWRGPRAEVWALRRASRAGAGSGCCTSRQRIIPAGVNLARPTLGAQRLRGVWGHVATTRSTCHRQYLVRHARAPPVPGTRHARDRGPPAPRPGGPDLDAGAL